MLGHAMLGNSHGDRNGNANVVSEGLVSSLRMKMDADSGRSNATRWLQDRIPRTWWGHLVWLAIAAAVAFVVPAVMVGSLQLPRPWYLVFYFAAIGSVVYAYVRWSGTDIRGLMRDRWAYGLLAGALISVFTVKTILVQPSSPMPQGADLVFNVVWLGLLYGTVDAVLLSVLPVYAVGRAIKALGWSSRWPSRLAAGALAILASMLVILVYHLGYPECRSPFVLVITAGVAIQSLGYVLSRSPLSPVLSHVAMHMAAVLYGLNTVSQLPPHY